MKYYTSTTEYNCGIRSAPRQMYVCVMDRQGEKLVHCNVKNNDFNFFLKLVEPYKHDLTVCCEARSAGTGWPMLVRQKRPLQVLLRQRICFVWRRAELLARIINWRANSPLRFISLDTISHLSYNCNMIVDLL